MLRLHDPQELDGLLPRLTRALEQEDLSFALLLGSASEGLPFRDLDVAVEPRSTVDPLPIMDFLDLGLRLERAAGMPVDVVWLPRAPIGLAYQASRGRLLVCRDPEVLADWRERTWREYLDLEPYFRRSLHDLLGPPHVTP